MEEKDLRLFFCGLCKVTERIMLTGLVDFLSSVCSVSGRISDTRLHGEVAKLQSMSKGVEGKKQTKKWNRRWRCVDS